MQFHRPLTVVQRGQAGFSEPDGLAALEWFADTGPVGPLDAGAKSRQTDRATLAFARANTRNGGQGALADRFVTAPMCIGASPGGRTRVELANGVRDCVRDYR